MTNVSVGEAAKAAVRRNTEEVKGRRQFRAVRAADLARHTCIVHDVGQGSDVWSFMTSEGPKEFRVSGGFLANASVSDSAARKRPRRLAV